MAAGARGDRKPADRSSVNSYFQKLGGFGVPEFLKVNRISNDWIITQDIILKQYIR